MKRGQKARRNVALGDLITSLFDESKKVSHSRMEQNFLVYLALRDLLRTRVHANHPIALTR
jgi:hypothetical protein